MNNITIDQSAKAINKLYDGLTYFDLYGSSVFIFLLVTLFVFLVWSYYSIMTNIQPIKDDWMNQRCNPKVMPFVSFINKPDGASIIDYTGENFTYCVQSVLTEISGYAIQPLTSLTSGLTSLYDKLQNSVNAIREMINKLRTNIANIARQIMGRILNVISPLQVIFIAFIDSMRKTQAVLTSGLYTSLGTYYTLQALMGSIIELIIKIILILLGIIAALWIMPLTWGAAAANSVIFLAISIPLAIIAALMSEVLHIQTSGIPKLKCFDENTIIQMDDDTFKTINKIKLGDKLQDNNIVTAIMKLDANNVQMYNLYDVIVSESHVVKYNNTWLKVCKHPDAVLINYNKPYLYCLNTTKKHILINNTIFTDWDEIYDDTLDKILGIQINNEKLGLNLEIKESENIHTYLDGGFIENTMIKLSDGKRAQINKIQIGDKLCGGDIVYGIVEIDASTVYKMYSYKIDNSLGESLNFCGGLNLNIASENIDNVKSTLDIHKSFIEVRKKSTTSTQSGWLSKVYHLLTDTGKFNIESVTFYDYNSCIDLFLDK